MFTQDVAKSLVNFIAYTPDGMLATVPTPFHENGTSPVRGHLILDPVESLKIGSM